MGSHHERGGDRRGFKQLISLVTFGFVVASVAKELRMPADERKWNGVVAGMVPYDFRMPTPARFRERVWDPDGKHIISPRVFGVGWTVNAGRVVKLVRERISEAR